MKTYKYYASLVLITFMFTSNFAQESTKVTVDFGADLASRYVWRGLEFSDSPAIQPYIEFSYRNLTLGAWASYETGGQVIGQEFDIYASYAFGDFSIDFTDYSFPVDGLTDKYFQIKSHIGEIMIGYDNTDKLPITIKAGANIYNDDKHSIYTELGLPFKIKNIDLTVFTGAGNEQYTRNKNFKLMNFGLSASKNIAITTAFSINTTARIVFNPDTSDAYFVFVLSL